MKCKDVIEKEMLSALIEKLKEEPGIDVYRIQEKILWEMFKNGCAHFVIRNNQIVGCCAIWHHSTKTGIEPAYVELGTLWSQKQDRASIVAELGSNIHRIAKGKKIMGFCKELKLAMHFKQSPVFPFNEIANPKNCPRELIELCSQFKAWQFRGWLNEGLTNQKYDRVLYQESNGNIIPWYLVFE